MYFSKHLNSSHKSYYITNRLRRKLEIIWIRYSSGQITDVRISLVASCARSFGAPYITRFGKRHTCLASSARARFFFVMHIRRNKHALAARAALCTSGENKEGREKKTPPATKWSRDLDATGLSLSFSLSLSWPFFPVRIPIAMSRRVSSCLVSVARTHRFAYVATLSPDDSRKSHTRQRKLLQVPGEKSHVTVKCARFLFVCFPSFAPRSLVREMNAKL